MEEYSKGEGKERPGLSENHFIAERKPPYPFWLWLAIGAIVVGMILGIGNWFQQTVQEKIESSPLLQVTNRDLSLFLWQFPDYMRVNASVKEGYLPDFEYTEGKVGIREGAADKIAVAPPELLFLYSIWAHQLKPYAAKRNFLLSELLEFLRYAPEWDPEQWKEAPASYRLLTEKLKNLTSNDLAQSTPRLPLEIEIALTGWKNYFYEGKEIDAVAPTYEELAKFIKLSPYYARNYWRNILLNKKPLYLLKLFKGNYKPNEKVSGEEISGFLKVSLYNWRAVENKS